MARYVSRRPKAETWCDGWDEGRLIDNVTVVESEPSFSGLFDQHGNEIWRMPDPIGFRFD